MRQTDVTRTGPGALDPAEIRLVSGIAALVLDEQPGQAAAAIAALRRRAEQAGITGGALKTLFERLAAAHGAEDERAERAAQAARAARAEVLRLQTDADAAAMQTSRLAAENAALRRRLAQIERRVRAYEMIEPAPLPQPPHTALPSPRRPRPAGMLAGVVAGAMLTILVVQALHFAGLTEPPRVLAAGQP